MRARRSAIRFFGCCDVRGGSVSIRPSIEVRVLNRPCGGASVPLAHLQAAIVDVKAAVAPG